MEGNLWAKIRKPKRAANVIVELASRVLSVTGMLRQPSGDDRHVLCLH
jgi:hypothetical protein